MPDLLRDLVMIFLAAGIVLHLFHRLRLPAIVGLLITGILIGPNASGIVKDRVEIDHMADIGIMLLMFSIGLDFTRERLAEFGRAFGMGLLQMAICIVVTAVAVATIVERWSEAILLGFLVAHTRHSSCFSRAVP
jgi:CPA2 family monovalent cation:H+ antiporter-2